MSTRNQRRKKAREKYQQTDVFKNSLTGLVEGIQMSNQMGLLTGGSTLSSFGTMAYSTNYALISLQQVMLTYFYASSGLFQTAIQLPVQDAVSKGIDIESDLLGPADIDSLMDQWDELGLWKVLTEGMSWARLFGGGAIIINTPQDPETPMNMKSLKGVPLEFYTADRWELIRGDSNMGVDEMNRGDFGSSEFYYYYGQRIHRSRIILMNGKNAPSRIRRQLSGWGMSEGERMIRDLNLYLKTQDVTYEILDQAKLDIYKLKGLAQKLTTPNGTATVQKRVELANELKNYLNALVMDADDDYEQKQLSFSGLADVMGQNMVGVAAALRIPMVKLFGLSPSGFNTGESDLLNYNQMVEGEVRTPLKTPIRKLIEILMYQKFGQTFPFRFDWPSLEQADAAKDEQINASVSNRLLAAYDRGLITAQEYGEIAEKEGLVPITLSATKGLLGDHPEPPNGAEGVEPMEEDPFAINEALEPTKVKVFSNRG